MVNSVDLEMADLSKFKIQKVPNATLLKSNPSIG